MLIHPIAGTRISLLHHYLDDLAGKSTMVAARQVEKTSGG
jgi:hypothetical protein